MYMQFGGHIEIDESPWQAISHELKEESGYDMNQLMLLQPPNRIMNLPSVQLHPVPFCYISHAFNNGHQHTDLSYGFVTDQPPAGAIAEEESQSVMLFTREELHSISLDKIYDNIKEQALFVFGTMLASYEKVPATSFK